MSVTTLIGGQWGDEGKGKVSDHKIRGALERKLGNERVVVVRYNGGPNAGHTICVGKDKFVVHNLASGIIQPGVLNVSGPLVVHDLEVVDEELALAEQRGSEVVLDSSAPVILPIHRLLDGAYDTASAGGSAIGTTKRGIGPAYMDFWSRDGLRLGDLVHVDRIRSALKGRGYYESRAATARHFGLQPMSLDDTVDWCLKYAPRIRPLLGDTRRLMADAHEAGWDILAEGAQGVMLDTIHGAAPYVTSSFCTPAALTASFGIHGLRQSPNSVIAVAKAYTTRVGGGPFPTEMKGQHQAVGEEIRQRGSEFGATTGRPRRCGWLDLVALRYACRVAGVTSLAITKLDVLSGMDSVRACTCYRLDGGLVWPNKSLTGDVLERAVPVYTDFPGWSEDISGARAISDLPANAREYLDFISRFVSGSARIDFVGVGPERDEIILSR